MLGIERRRLAVSADNTVVTLTAGALSWASVNYASRVSLRIRQSAVICGRWFESGLHRFIFINISSLLNAVHYSSPRSLFGRQERLTIFVST